MKFVSALLIFSIISVERILSFQIPGVDLNPIGLDNELCYGQNNEVYVFLNTVKATLIIF